MNDILFPFILGAGKKETEMVVFIQRLLRNSFKGDDNNITWYFRPTSEKFLFLSQYEISRSLHCNIADHP